MYYCVTCSDDVAPQRWQLGRHTCLKCGEQQARAFKHCIVNMAKSNYQPVTDLNMLKTLNKYTQVA
jgi:ribosomal protein L37AE/L43A